MRDLHVSDTLVKGPTSPRIVTDKHPHLIIRGYVPLLLLLSLISYSKLASCYFPRDSSILSVFSRDEVNKREVCECDG
jgi:hypothetical protein